jgi:glutamyl/glutaminyl-tRNA synthetase
MKTDGFPTYHLANVIDDHLMGITHVIRAEEWIPSTPKHVALYEAFGWEQPQWIHMPLLRNPDKGKSKISKRKNPVSLLYYRDRGFLPEALVNYLSLMGWSFPGEEKEIFTLKEFIENFDIERVSLGGPVFDLSKLEWMNGNYLRGLDDEELTDRLVEFLDGRDFWNPEHIKKLVPLLKDRITVLSEFDELASFYHGTPFISAFSSTLMNRGVSTVREGLNNLRTFLENNNPYWNNDELDKSVSIMKAEDLETAMKLFNADNAEELAHRLFFQGKSFSLKLCKDGADTLKKLLPKKRTVEELGTVLGELADSFESLDWNEEILESHLKTFAEARELGAGDLLMPVRIGCLGKSATPGLYESMVLVGKDRCRSRLLDMIGLMKEVKA